jgi:hypothetical protein
MSSLALDFAHDGRALRNAPKDNIRFGLAIFEDVREALCFKDCQPVELSIETLIIYSIKSITCISAAPWIWSHPTPTTTPWW